MKKIYSFLTAALATLAMNAQTFSGEAYYDATNSNWKTYTYDEEATLTGTVTVDQATLKIANFLGSGSDVVFNCLSDGTIEYVSATKATSTYTLSSLATLSAIDFEYDSSDLSWELYKGEYWVWLGAYCTTEGGETNGSYMGVEFVIPSDNFVPEVKVVDPRIKDTEIYSSDTKEFYSVKAVNYEGTVTFTNFTEYYSGEPLKLTITTNADGSKSVSSNLTASPGYYYNSELGDYFYLYKGYSTFTYGESNGEAYVQTAAYAGSNGSWNYIYFYIPEDDWAGIDAVDTDFYTYGNTTRTYTDWQKVSTKWDFDNQQFLVPDFLGSKQDVLVTYNDRSLTGIWSLSEYFSTGTDDWGGEYSLFYDDSEDSTLAFYPWFDGVPTTDLYLYAAYGAQALASEYKDIVLCAWADYADGAAHASQYEYYYFYPTLPEASAVKSIESVDNSNAPVEYFNLQGVRVANPENGLFIRRQGSKVSKVVVK